MNELSLHQADAVLFDLEGTLVGFEWNIEGAVRDTLKMLGASGFPIEHLRGKTYSALMMEAIRMGPELGCSPDRVREQVGAIYDRYDEDAFHRWTLRPGARKLLIALRKKGIKSGLVSNVGRQAARKGIAKLRLRNKFQVVVTRNDVNCIKPSGEGILLALDRLDVEKACAFHVGDSIDDVYAAKDAGVKVIIITGDEHPKAELLSAKPDWLIAGFPELVASLERNSP